MERRFVIKEVPSTGASHDFSIPETELKRRLEVFSDEAFVNNEGFDKIIDILLHGLCGADSVYEKQPIILSRAEPVPAKEPPMDFSTYIKGVKSFHEPQKPTRKEWVDAIKLCIQAIEMIHPELTSEEPCIAYEAWSAAKRLLT